MKGVYIYVSAGSLLEESLEPQLKAAHEWCRLENIRQPVIVSDTGGMAKNRLRMVNEATNGDLILCESLARWSMSLPESVHELVTLRERSVIVRFWGDPALTANTDTWAMATLESAVRGSLKMGVGHA